MRKAEVWKTTDGEIFDDEQMAFQHERYLIIKFHMKSVIKSVIENKNIPAMYTETFEQIEENFISSYEVLKHAVEMIEYEINKLDGEEDAENKNENGIFEKHV